MNTIKVSELTGGALDWAVARIEKPRLSQSLSKDVVVLAHGGAYAPSINWVQGGPIIEREFICIEGRAGMAEGWAAHYSKKREALYFYHIGDTPLIAAMRCYVASKLGNTLEVPKELIYD